MSVPAEERARPYGVAVQGDALRLMFQVRGVTCADVARRAEVAASTVSQAVNGRRVHPRKLQAIVAALTKIEPIPELVSLLAVSREAESDA